MENSKKIQKYMNSAREWLRAAEKVVEAEPNPAAFNALHAIELAAKACLMDETGEEFTTHQIGGSFGKHFREEIGERKAKRLNRLMMEYSRLRYPNAKSVNSEESKKILKFAKEFVKDTVPTLLQ
ncbi:hypothetical protein AKJ62_03535 [candidate division MSBL1 archaeon SCGC-AAA259D14]|uniref:HEPN domain-containing protein n=1 Tax=candidate division MSBL1 archaeon SCGC-AAA259D14 TaxID=1698261 RepID=A0A133U4V7_9EURY|nr:hypothetical protein AKJ62_03535 [candidate division MSBL1 archaeon SCGC-AAA259D14]